MKEKTITQLSLGLLNKKFSSEELTKFFLDRIDKFNPQLNSFITVTHDLAINQARIADNLRKNGLANQLTGIPIAHKDIFCTAGILTSCGSKMLSNFIAPYNATVVEKLYNAGMVVLGKTNMDEFAMGSSNENSFYGSVKNPWNLNMVPGGSSGGSAAAVAAWLAPAATATDTGGSIRQPAALCGLTGIKPTYGLVSRWGMIAYASSLDQGGPIARTAEDCALILRAMAGFDPLDSTSVNYTVPDYYSLINRSIKGIKIGIPKEYFDDGLDKIVGNTIENAIKQYQKLGAIIKDISLPNSKLAVPAYYIIAPAECSSNLARFDGVRYGYRCDNPKNLLDLYIRSRTEGFGNEVKRRILLGTFALSAGYYEDYYLKAQKIRKIISEDFKKAFEQVNLIAGPTSPTVAFSLGAKTVNPISMYLSDIYTIAVNLAGLPGISLPVGFVNKLPVGLQLIGNYFMEDLILNAAHCYQKVTDWHLNIPEEFATF